MRIKFRKLNEDEDHVTKTRAQVVGALDPSLRRKPWADHPNPLAGHCYVASEAMYHLLGGKAAGWTPQHVRHEGGPHWYLKHKDGRIEDPTGGQFSTPVPYHKGKGMGFLTRQPSKRAQTVIDRVKDRRDEEYLDGANPIISEAVDQTACSHALELKDGTVIRCEHGQHEKKVKGVRGHGQHGGYFRHPDGHVVQVWWEHDKGSKSNFD